MARPEYGIQNPGGDHARSGAKDKFSPSARPPDTRYHGVAITRFAYKLIFPGNPIPLARPRLGKYKVYDPQKDLKKITISCLFQQKINWQKLEGAIGMAMEFHMPIPKCSEAQKYKVLNSPHVKKPDLSNMIKYYEDCLQPHVFENDSQIVECTARKINSLIPRTIIHVWRVVDGDI